MARICYGDIILEIDNDVALSLRPLIRRIVEAGSVEWMPLAGVRKGEPLTLSFLVGPGIPTVIETDGIEDGASTQFDSLWDRFVGDGEGSAGPA